MLITHTCKPGPVIESLKTGGFERNCTYFLVGCFPAVGALGRQCGILQVQEMLSFFDGRQLELWPPDSPRRIIEPNWGKCLESFGRAEPAKAPFDFAGAPKSAAGTQCPTSAVENTPASRTFLPAEDLSPFEDKRNSCVRRRDATRGGQDPGAHTSSPMRRASIFERDRSRLSTMIDISAPP